MARTCCLMLCGLLFACGDTDAVTEPTIGGEVGQRLPPLNLITADGEPFSTEQLAAEDGDVALLYVTATWCFTCGPEIDWLNARLAAGDHRVNPVVVVVEDEKYEPAGVVAAQGFIEHYGPQFRTVADPDQVMSPYRDANAIPLNLLLRVDTMTVLHRSQGFSEQSLAAAIDEATQ